MSRAVNSSARPCPACLAARAVPRYAHLGVHFVQCGDCRSIYHAPPPDWERIHALYQADYHAARGHSDNPAVEATKQATMRSYLDLLRRFRPPGRRLVEVGCSAGAGLAAAAAGGWDVRGVEISKGSAELAAARPGVRAVYAGRLEDAPIAERDVDVFALFDVIEHIDPPDSVLAAMHRMLVPDGLALFLTPDAGSWSARWMGTRWPHLFLEHVVLYSRAGLRRALERAGFEVLHAAFAWKRVSLEVLERHARLHPHIRFGAALRTLASITPREMKRWMLPFNLGEFYLVARRTTGARD